MSPLSDWMILLRVSRLRSIGIVLATLWSLVAISPAAVSAGLPHSEPDTSVAAQRLLVRGMTESSLGDYEEAIEYFESALAHAPQSPALLQALADAYGAQDELTTALFYARQARKFGSVRAYYHRRLAELQQKAGAPDDAVQTYRTLLDQFPDQFGAYQALARLQSDLDRPREALETYNALKNRQSQISAGVYRNMLALYRQIGDKDGVRTTLEALVELRPSTPQYRRALAQQYRENDQLDAAIALLEPLVRTRPNDSELRTQLRQLYRETGQARTDSSLTPDESDGGAEASAPPQLVSRAKSLLEEAASPPTGRDTSLLQTAERLLVRALEQTAPAPDTRFLLAQVLAEQGNYREAGQAYERALAENPRSPTRWVQAARLYLKGGYSEEAAAVAEEGLLLFPGEFPLAQTAGEAFLHAQNPEQSLQYFQKALALRDTTQSPEAAGLHAGIGLAYTHLDRLDDATRALEKAVSAAPDEPLVLSRFAYSLAVRNQQLDRALELAQRAVERAPENPAYQHTLGWVYLQRGNFTAAEGHFQKALDAGPPSAPLLEHIGDLHHVQGNDALARRYWNRALERAPSRGSLKEKVGTEPGT